MHKIILTPKDSSPEFLISKALPINIKNLFIFSSLFFIPYSHFQSISLLFHHFHETNLTSSFQLFFSPSYSSLSQFPYPSSYGNFQRWDIALNTLWSNFLRSFWESDIFEKCLNLLKGKTPVQDFSSFRLQSQGRAGLFIIFFIFEKIKFLRRFF